MALDPKYLQSLPNSLIDMYGLVEIDILVDMARRISTYDFFIPSAQFQLQKLEELGGVRDEIIAKLSALTGKTQTEIVELLTEAGEVAIADDVEYYKAAQVYAQNKINSEALYKNLNNGLIHTQQAFKNITKTTANTATKQFENALDRAWLQINTGGMDYITAIRNAIKDLSEAGVGSVEYKSGRVDNIEVAVRRAIVTGANQTAILTQETLADELGVDLVETTAHGGARPSHAKWQGKCFSRNGRKVIDGVVYEDLRKATGYGSAGGLCGVNCRHSFHPYVHGTARTWSDEQLKKLDEKNIEYNGEKYTEYEASQIQRGLERQIRKQKRTVEALEAAGLDASAERKKLRDAQKAYTDFTKQTGIRKQQARTQIGTSGTAGYTPPAPAKALPTPTPAPAKPKADKTFEGYSEKEKKDLENLLQKAPTEEYNILAKFDNDLQPVLEDTDRGYFSRSDGRVHFKKAKAAAGSDYQTPYQLHFHEYGHNIDWLAGGGTLSENSYKSIQYLSKDGKNFEQIIADDWDAVFYKKHGEEAFLKAFDDQTREGGMGAETYVKSLLNRWRRNNGVDRKSPEFVTLKEGLENAAGSDEKLLAFYKDNRSIFEKPFKPTKAMIEAFCNDIKQAYSMVERADVSDMFERYSVKHGGQAYPFSLGHGKAYATTEGRLAKEAFAEMFSAELSNPGSLELIKEFLPNAYKAYKEMLQEVYNEK